MGRGECPRARDRRKIPRLDLGRARHRAAQARSPAARQRSGRARSYARPQAHARPARHPQSGQAPVTPAPLSGSDPRAYPDRPFLAVSAVVERDGRILVVRRARPPVQDRYTLPGGVVEAGETLLEAVRREVEEETAVVIEPIDIAAYREGIAHHHENRPRRHFVIIVFAARWRGNEAKPNEEIAEVLWIEPDALRALPTTDGLAEIVAK